jgi:hypothetical protein
MFKNKTVFILGAGASWHYGYPTGEELVQKIISKSLTIEDCFRISAIPPINGHRPDYIARNSPHGASGAEIQAEWKTASKELTDLAKRLKQVNPLVIDYFLGQNADLQPIGKLMIALVILECEALFLSGRANENRRELLRQSPLFDERKQARQVALQFFRDDWYRFILHKLVMNCQESCDILKNDVQFVTFNYDVSLEYELALGLRSISLFETKDIDEFLGGDRFLHVYGKVRDSATALPSVEFDFLSGRGGPYQYNEDKGEMGKTLKPLLDTAYKASKNLRVISPSDKELDAKVIEAAKSAIRDAACVYILGYGFDENNSMRLDLSNSLKLDPHSGSLRKVVLFTNFGDINRVNKRASKLFFGNYLSFLPSRPFIWGDPMNVYCEKSIRDVYEALAFDFDALEEQLVAGSQI